MLGYGSRGKALFLQICMIYITGFVNYYTLSLKIVVLTVQSVCVYSSSPGQLRLDKQIINRLRGLLQAVSSPDKFQKDPRGVLLSGRKLGKSCVESKDEGKQRQLWTGSLRLVTGESRDRGREFERLNPGPI